MPGISAGIEEVWDCDEDAAAGIDDVSGAVIVDVPIGTIYFVKIDSYKLPSTENKTLGNCSRSARRARRNYPS